MIARPCRYPGCPALVIERGRTYCDKHSATVLRPCREPGCPALVHLGEGKCAKHREEEAKAYDARRGSARDRGYGTAWDKLRRMYLAANPLCEDHKARGKVVEAVMVHHKVPISEGGDPLAWDNLRSLCSRCHAIRHKGRRLRDEEAEREVAICNEDPWPDG
jgi:5-methylcytosine-specific restriction enzyme A